jgi:hypothetical protein
VNGSAANTSLTTMVVDQTDSWYIAGNYTGTPTLSSTSTGAITLAIPVGGNATYVAKYNSSGVPQFASRIDRTLAILNVSLQVDLLGNIFVSGQYDTTGNPPIVSNASGAASAITLPTLDTSSKPASFIVKYTNLGVAEWATALYGIQINKMSLNNNFDVVAVGSYTSNVTLYNPDSTISGLTEPASLNNTSTGMIIEFSSTGYPMDCKVVDSTGSVQMNDVVIDSQDHTIAIGNFTKTPSIYNNKGVVANSNVPNISGGLIVGYDKSTKSTYNLPSSLTTHDNGFVKYIKNDGPTSTSINVIRSDTQAVQIATHTINAGSTGTFLWNNKWHRMG